MHQSQPTAVDLAKEKNRKVDWLVGCTTDILQVYRRFGYESNKHEKALCAEDYSYEDAEKKRTLDDLLSEMIGTRLQYGADDSIFKEMAHSNAKRYISSPWMHAPTLTRLVLVDLLDAELAPLKREAAWNANSAANIFPEPWRTYLPYLYRFGCLTGVLFLFDRGWRVAGVMWAAYIALDHALQLVRYAHLTRLAGALQLIRNEVASGYYDAAEIANRLRRWEAKGLYVHSLTYPLLI
jgi:hypothetical protein